MGQAARAESLIHFSKVPQLESVNMNPEPLLLFTAIAVLKEIILYY